MPKLNDITGQRFGRLTAIEPYKYDRRNGRWLWLCQCDCGRRTVMLPHKRRVLRTRSCGCLKRAGKHGRSGTRLYRVWADMLQRCENPRHSRYRDYGGRGIGVCARWHEFVDWHANVGEGAVGLSLHRIDNDRGYEPGNVKWATPKEQASNRRPRKQGGLR